jgi:hypothetical protein
MHEPNRSFAPGRATRAEGESARKSPARLAAGEAIDAAFVTARA